MNRESSYEHKPARWDCGFSRRPLVFSRKDNQTMTFALRRRTFGTKSVALAAGFLALFLLSPGAHAQPTVNKIANLSFGTVVSGGGTYTVSLGAAGEGSFSIYGTKGTTVYVTLLPPANMTYSGNNVPYSWAASYNSSANSASGATTFAGTTASFPLNTRINKTTYAAYVYVYGSANLTSTFPPGSYSGLFSLSASYIASGSPSKSNQLTVGATVIQGLTMSASGPLNFGTLIAGTIPNSISPQTSASAVAITLTGNGGQSVTVTYPSSATLTSGTNSLTFTPNLAGYSTLSQTKSSTVSSGSIVKLSGKTGSTGNYYLWLGGSIPALSASTASGNYSGTITLSATY